MLYEILRDCVKFLFKDNPVRRVVKDGNSRSGIGLKSDPDSNPYRKRSPNRRGEDGAI